MRYLSDQNELPPQLTSDESVHGRPVLLASDPSTPATESGWRFGPAGIVALGRAEAIRSGSVDFVLIQNGTVTLGEVKSNAGNPARVRIYGPTVDRLVAEQAFTERQVAVSGVVHIAIPAEYPKVSTTTVTPRIPGEEANPGSSGYGLRDDSSERADVAAEQGRAERRRRVGKAVRAFLKDAK